MNKRRILRSLIIIVTALSLSALIAWGQIQTYRASAPMKTSAATTLKAPASREAAVAGMQVGGPFTLTDHAGEVFTEENLRGRYVLLYFGFTYCPAICPTELQKMTVALNQAGEALAGQILPVFITVDPERDTQDVMKNYVAQFYPGMVGLTGTPEQVATALKAYKIYARKVEDPALSEYTMDHSSYIYFLDPEGGLIGIYGTNSKPSEITAAIRANVSP